jgi:restriction system protein
MLQLFQNQKKLLYGSIIEIVGPAYSTIIKEIEKDNDFIFKFTKFPRKLEELIAGAYTYAGWDEVTLTPASHDGGKDIIATKNGVSIRVYDQIKAFSKNRKVTVDDVRAIYGVMVHEQNVSKCIISTSSEFAPSVYDEFKNEIPFRLQLRNGKEMIKWLLDMYKNGTSDFDIKNIGFYRLYGQCRVPDTATRRLDYEF